jgi:hypothetical protein
MSSTARTAAGPETGRREQRREIHGVDVTVEFERPPFPASCEYNFPAPTDAPFTLHHIPVPPEALAVSDARFEAVCDLVRTTPEIRRGLNLLKERFPRFVLDDAVCRLGGIDPSYEPDESHESMIGAALASAEDGGDGAVAIGEADAPVIAFDYLDQHCPGLPLQTVRPLVEAPDSPREQNLRLMLFYTNCLRHWKGSDLTGARRKIMDTIRENITKLTRALTPGKLVKRHELAVLRHINTK